MALTIIRWLCHPHACEKTVLNDCTLSKVLLGDEAKAHIDGIYLAVGGVLLMMPDFITETFYEGTDAGGSDAPDGRAIRLMEWRWDPDPDDASFQVEMSLLLREQDGTVRAVHERHTMSLFSHATWWKHIRAAGLQPHDCTADLLGLELDSGVGELFVARRT